MESEKNIRRVGHKKTTTVCTIVTFRSFCEVGPQLLCAQGSLSTNWASLQQQHRPCVGFCLSSPPWGKGPLLRKSKVTISFTSMDTILSSILFCSLSCKNNPVFPLERGWNCSKSKWLCASLWVTSLCLRAQPEGVCCSHRCSPAGVRVSSSPDASQFCNRAVAAALARNRTSALSWYCWYTGSFQS